MAMNPEVVSNVKAELGEGPSWDANQEILYWVDIRRGIIYGHKLQSSDEILVASLGESVSCVVPRSNGGLALTMQHGYYGLDLSSKKLEPLSEQVETDLSVTRFNDGKCDPAGRFWAGTMDDTEKNPSGSLYVLNKDRKLKKVVSQVTVSNGMGWSPDDRSMYYIDSPTRKVSSFDYSLQSGEISNRRTCVDFGVNNQKGVPDGMTVDSDGMLWVAHWGGAKITRWNPSTGKLLQSLDLPADHVTSVCFAGKNLDELYITTARADLDPPALAAQPLAGSLFRANVGVTGLPTYSFQG
jgi:sugar lactone lactonase YvrE